MLHISDDTIPKSSQTTDRLAHRFLDLLARDIPQLRDRADDPIDEALGIEPNLLAPSGAALQGDLGVMAVSLARAFEKTPDLVAQARHRAPKICIRLNSQHDVELAIEVLKCTVFKRMSGLHNPAVSRKTDYTTFGGADVVAGRVTLQMMREPSCLTSPTLLVSSNPAIEASSDALRRFDHHLRVPPIDISCINLVVSRVTGVASTIEIDPEVLGKISYSDCGYAIDPGRTPEEIRDVLVEAVRARQATAPSGKQLKDLAGYGEAKTWGLEAVQELEAYRSGRLSWCDVPYRSLLLCGPPGTGKTSFAMALARSAGVPMIASSIAEWNSAKDLGGTLRAMLNAFQRARAAAPCVLLIDEFDGISSRSRLIGNHVEYWQQIINLLLEQLDGHTDNEGIIIIAATNFPGSIDPALLRAGRIGTRINIALPGADDLGKIFGLYLDGQFGKNDLRAFGRMSLGKTGADVEAIVRQAKAAARRRGRPLRTQDIIDAVGGNREPLSPELKRRVAIHEAGHAVVATVLDIAPVVSLSIAGGTGMMMTGPMRSAYTLQSARDRMAIALAGRAAEELVLGEAGSGSGGGLMSDLSVATQVAAELEMRLGFGEMGLPYTDIDLAQAALIPDVLPSIRRHLDEAMARASAILLEHRDYLDRLTVTLLDDEVLLGKEIAAIQHVRSIKTPLHLVREQ